MSSTTTPSRSRNSQLAAPSPYNTRLNPGLPPTPISNPGLAAIEAAAHPAQTNYLYFVVKPCGNGASVFSSSYSQFLADSARYQQARAAKGGQLADQVLRARARRTRLGVIGWPVAHSRSPQMMEAGAGGGRADGLALPAAADPARAVLRDGPALPQAGFRGANVTIPHKQAALAARR